MAGLSQNGQAVSFQSGLSSVLTVLPWPEKMMVSLWLGWEAEQQNRFYVMGRGFEKEEVNGRWEKEGEKSENGWRVKVTRDEKG